MLKSDMTLPILKFDTSASLYIYVRGAVVRKVLLASL